MKRSLIQHLRCPDHASARLSLQDEELDGDGQIIEGRLRCALCDTDFPIVQGIAVLLPENLRAASSAGGLDDARRQMLEEMSLRDDESTLYDELYNDRAYSFELETYLRWLQARPGETILDIGCGTGRVTKEYIEQVDLVVAADFSLKSLRVLIDRLSPAARHKVLPVCCEVGHLPFPADLFDAAVSTSLFSNVPTAGTRADGLREVHRVLAPGARFLVSVYNHCWMKRIRYRLGVSRSGGKQGRHSEGRVTYYNFDRKEFIDWVGGHFTPGRCFGLLHRVPILSRSSATLAAWLDRWLYHVPGSMTVVAKEIGMVARKP